MTVLQNKIDFAVVLRVERANPNGDPLNGNRPRTDYGNFGEMTDVSIKRKIRDRLLEKWIAAGKNMDDGNMIYVQSDDRKADERKRKLVLQTIHGEYQLDFMVRQLSHITSNARTAVAVHEHDALRSEIADFLTAVRTKARPRVTANQAALTMKVAWQILKAIGQ